MNAKGEIQVSISDEILRGTYSNQIVISHSRGEFVMDCMMVFPPKGITGARVIVSPGHAKRLLKALQNNIATYEKSYGEIPEEAPPAPNLLN